MEPGVYLTMVRWARRGLTVAVTISTLMAFGVPGLGAVSGALGAVEIPANVSQGAWAYGAYKAVNVSGTGHDQAGSYTYTLSASYGWQVIFNQTNASATVRALEIQRTMAATVAGTLCQPNCASPIVTANVSVKALESMVGFANLTTSGTVYENGLPVPAVALINTSSQAHAN